MAFRTLIWNSQSSQISLRDRIREASNYIHSQTSLGGANEIIMSSKTYNSLEVIVTSEIDRRDMRIKNVNWLADGFMHVVYRFDGEILDIGAIIIFR